ncbi:MAG TPA: rhodanese-like domain-containing protein [Saprospiraceae bacterium]|nr:rhodanese-like domain-containing protein [Saprospiraceae bacterium]
MKKLILFFGLFLLVAGASCQQQGGNAPGDPATVEVISVENFAQDIAAEGIQVVDVRTQEEVDQGTITGAMHIDFFADDFQAQLEEKLDKEKPVYVFCRSGNRSNKAANMMADMGFTKVYDMDGGWVAWSKKE